jgi:hypothetical protein
MSISVPDFIFRPRRLAVKDIISLPKFFSATSLPDLSPGAERTGIRGFFQRPQETGWVTRAAQPRIL